MAMSEAVLLTYANARKLVVLIIGATIILVGIALLVLPGPGTVVIILGLALLGTEFVWARRLLKRVKEEGSNAARSLWSVLRGRKK
jgi:uncharacterized protein (TIGR02611 family)